MENIIDGLNNMVELIENNGQDIIMNPLTWIIVIIIAVGIYGLYDVSDKVKQNGLANIVRQFVQTILDTTGDFINALRSLSGFIGILRQLLFGKLNDKTLFILINYAIVFMSMASFVTTFNGLKPLAGFSLAAFISFGVQVSILICTTRIYNLYVGDEKENKKVHKNYFLHQVNEEDIGVKTGKILFKNDDKKEKDLPGVEIPVKKGRLDKKKGSKEKGNRKKEKENKREKLRGLKILVIAFLLVPSVLMSSFFSYVFMFNKFIKEQLVLDDHFRTITVAHEISNEYSEDISKYVSDITDVLNQYNAKIGEWLKLQENNPAIQQAELDDLKNTIEEINGDIAEQEYTMNEAEDTSPEYAVAVAEITRLNEEKSKYEAERDTKSETMRNDTEYQIRKRAYENIQILTEFYGNPLYLVDGKVEDVRKSFFDLQMEEKNYRDNLDETENAQLDDDMARQIQKVFESYVTLNEYFSSHNKYGLDFSKINSIIADIEYDEKEYDENMKGDDVYKETTNGILLEMIEIMNEVPIISDLENVWTGENIKAPAQLSYLDKIYDLYRDNNGKSESFERAIKKLIGLNSEKITLAIELAVFALMVDLTIVWLTLLRGHKQHLSNTADLRRLIGVLFIDDSMSRESEKRRSGQGFCVTIGIVSGVLVYMLYKIGGNGRGDNDRSDMFVFLFMILLGLIIALLIYKAYYKVQSRKQNWEDETLYLKWKEIWTANVGTEGELRKRVCDFKNGRMPDEIDLNENNIASIIRLWQDEEREKEDKSPLLTKFFYENMISLMENIEMKKCYKTTFIREVEDKKPAKVDYISETIMLPCVSEKIVEKSKIKAEFSILLSQKLVFFDYIDTTEREGCFILSERFWNLLYDAVLIRAVGGRFNELDIEEEMLDYGEDEED